MVNTKKLSSSVNGHHTEAGRHRVHATDTHAAGLCPRDVSHLG